MKFLLPIGIILAFSFCYMEWGGDNSAFVFEAEKAIFEKGANVWQSLTHPLILSGLLGQLALLIGAFTEGKLSRRLTLTGVILLGLIVFFVLLAGLLSLNWKAIGSTLPFLILVGVYFRQRKKAE